jgi:hypothetical protein
LQGWDDARGFNISVNLKQLTEENAMAVTTTSIKLNARLVDEAAAILGAKSRTDAVHTALREIVALRRFKKVMKKRAGKLEFAGCD